MRRILLKDTWGTSLVIAMAVMTQGLWATVHFEGTVEAVAAERRGHAAILVASVMLLALSLVAHRVLAAPPLTPAPGRLWPSAGAGWTMGRCPWLCPSWRPTPVSCCHTT